MWWMITKLESFTNREVYSWTSISQQKWHLRHLSELYGKIGSEYWVTYEHFCGQCWIFQIHWHIECSTFTPSSFRTLNSSTGISSTPLALFIVMLLKAHLTLHSRMSGSRWVIISPWLPGSWRYFLSISSVYSCHLFLIPSASVRSIPFLHFMLIVTWNVPLVSLVFLKRSLVFPILLFSSYFFALITEEGFLISPCYSLELCIQIGISFFFSFAFSWKRPVFIPIPKKGNAKECSNYHKIALISHTRKLMLKILQARLQ